MESVYATAATKPASVNWTNSLGNALIRYVDIEIGGQRIDRHFGLWLELWDELTQTSEKRNGYNHMIGKYAASIGLKDNALNPRIYYVPLMFWFCRNPGLSLPLIALQYHEVKIVMEFRDANELIVGLDALYDRDYAACTTSIQDGGLSLQTAALWVDYVYLDTDERRRFAQMSHEYLIDQVQFHGSEPVIFGTSSNYKFRLNFNHPVKELVWVLQRNVNAQRGTCYNDWFNFSASNPGTPAPQTAVDLMADAKILLNGHDRFATRPQTYFRLVQPYQHHTRIPDKHIYVYSFGLRPEEHQPSGTCNFSRIDNAQLVIDLTAPANFVPTTATPPGNWDTATGQFDIGGNDGVVYIFAPNYNVLRIMSGMGGLAYSD